MRVDAQVMPKDAAVPGQDAARIFEAVLAAALQTRQDGSGYRLATSNEVWPPATEMRGTEIPAAAQEAHPDLTGEVLAFKAGGETVVVRRADNPGLYDYAEAVSKVPDSQMNTVRNEGLGLLRGSDPLPLDQISSWVGYGSGDLWKVGLKDGKEVMVQRDMTPGQFDGMMGTIKGYDDGYRMLEGGRDLTDAQLEGAKILPPNKDHEGFIGLEVDGEKLHVSSAVNSGLYDRAVAQYEASHEGEITGAVDEGRRAHDLPEVGKTDLGGMETGEADPKDKNRKLTVNELTWKDLLQKWKDGTGDGSIGADDERAQLYRALQARGAAEDGLNMVGLDIATGQSLEKTIGKDFDTIIDGGKVDARIEELLSSDAVGEDLKAARGAALEKAAGGGDAARRLEEMAFSPEYMQHLAALRKDGKSDVAEADIGRVFDQLLVADPQKAADFAQAAQVDALTMDLNEAVANPDQVSQENLVTATQDAGKTVLQVLKKLGVDAPRRLVESEKFLEEVIRDKKTAGDFGKAMQELGALYAKNGTIGGDDIERLLGSGGKYASLSEATDGGALKALDEMNKAGVLGSTGGMISLASGVYQLAGKGGTLADTPEERLSVAKDFISFVASGKNFMTLGLDLYDTANASAREKADGKKPVGAPPTPTAADMFGLSKSLPDLFGERSGTVGGGIEVDPKFRDALISNIQGTINFNTDAGKLAERLGGGITEADAQKLIDGMQNGFTPRPDLPEGASGWKRGASAVLQVLDAGGNTAVGVLDSVIGGLTIRKGLDSGSDETVAKGALQLASGAFGTAAGVFSMAGLGGLNALKAAAAPSFFISAVLSVATLIPDIILDEKNRKAMNAHHDDLQALFTQLDKDGLLAEGGLDRYRYLDASIYTFGQRDAPSDQGILDYRSEEVQAWLEKWKEGADRRPDTVFTSDIYFEDLDHKDYKGDGANLDSQMDD
ncbi:hypothetical protein VQH23_04735 [Pararoseomonas sp. SCSIO 73927]|uniref:hypothetical protein n=1 Tax=Pararoseomonas sp. SCSIO 73927 TaxID=3114537 RepID=UPI0030CC8B93